MFFFLSFQFLTGFLNPAGDSDQASVCAVVIVGYSEKKNNVQQRKTPHTHTISSLPPSKKFPREQRSKCYFGIFVLSVDREYSFNTPCHTSFPATYPPKQQTRTYPTLTFPYRSYHLPANFIFSGILFWLEVCMIEGSRRHLLSPYLP